MIFFCRSKSYEASKKSILGGCPNLSGGVLSVLVKIASLFFMGLIEKPAVEIAEGAVNFPGANIPCGEMVRFRAAKFFKRINSTRCKYRRNFDAKFSCGDTS